MSTIKAANVQNTGSGAPTFKNSSGTEIGQLAKAWINFNGTGTIAIRDSFNVSSISDLATGEYAINFTNSMADTNYCFNCSSGATFNVDVHVFNNVSQANMETGTIRVGCRYSSSDHQHQRDCEIVCVTIFQN